MIDARRLCLCKYSGGKSRIARWVVRHLPQHDRYVEAFAGAANVLLNKPRVRSEWLIEREPSQANLLRVVRDRGAELAARLSRSRHCRDTFDEVRDRLRRGEWGDDLELAELVYLRQQLSWGGVGRIYSYRSRRAIPAMWSRCLGQLPRISARLHGVEIIEGDSMGWIPLLDGPDTLFYCDPPYLWSTRSDYRFYHHEMDDGAHRDLLSVLDAVCGKVVISGYPDPLYDRSLEGWARVSIETRCHVYSGSHRPKRTEVLWMSHARRSSRPG